MRSKDSPTLTVSVIVPMYNEEQYIKKFMTSLMSQTIFKSEKYITDIILVDGCSTDTTVEKVYEVTETYKNILVRIIDNPRKYVPISMNLGILASDAQIIIRLDVHAIYPDHYAETLIEFLVCNQESSVMNVGAPCKTMPGNSSDLAKAIACVLTSRLGIGGSFRVVKQRDGISFVDTVPFGCFWRTDLLKVGMYDEDMIRNQDDELNWRIKKAGGKIALLPIDNFLYFSRVSLQKHWLMFFQYGLFKPLTFLKSKSIGSIRAFAPLLLFLLILIVVIDSFFISQSIELALYFFCFLIIAYSVIGFVISTSNRKLFKLKFFPLVTFIAFITHFSYGLGFFIGIFRCIFPFLFLETYRDSR